MLRNLKTVNVNKASKVYLVTVTSKDLSTHVLVLLPVETISMFLLKNAVKKKLLEKILRKL